MYTYEGSVTEIEVNNTESSNIQILGNKWDIK